jgi:hypothetical protein
MINGKSTGGLGLCLFGLKEPERGPRVLMTKSSPSREFFYRVMYVVFLLYSLVAISSGMTSMFYLLSQMFFGIEGISGILPSLLSLFLLLSLGKVRDFWRDNLELYRMDDNFSGVGYLQRHLDCSEWTRAKELFDSLCNDTISPIDKEVIRRDLTRLARETPSIYEAIYELSDERMRWTLVHASL